MYVIKSKNADTYVGGGKNFESAIVVNVDDPMRMVFAKPEYAERFMDEHGLIKEDHEIIPETDQ